MRFSYAGLAHIIRDSLHFFAARVRHGDPRYRHSKPEREAVHGPRWIKRRRRADAPWLVRHRLPATRAELGAHAAERRGRIRGHALDNVALQLRADCDSLHTRF